MSEMDIFVKTKARELAREFQTADKKKNSAKRKQTMRRVIANVTMGNHDMVNLFPDVIKVFTFDDVQLKRMCYHYFGVYGIARPDIESHLIPIVLKDLKSVNLLIVKLALNCLVSMPVEEFATKAVKSIKSFLEEKDPALRKMAIYAIGVFYEKNSKLCSDEGLVDALKFKMGDSNPSVASSALSVLNELCENTEKLHLSLNIEQALFLTDFLSKSDEWQQIAILNSLMNFVPQTHEDAHIIIDKVMPFFQHKNSAVVLNGFKLLLYLLNYVDYIEDYIPRKLAASLTSLLSRPPELQFLVLRNVILLVLSKPSLIPFDVSLFFCDYNDPIYVKDTKLEIIYLLANESNLDLVLSELQQYSTGVDIQMSRKSIRGIGNLAVKIENAAKDCVAVLLDLISFGVDYVIQEAVIVFRNILRRYNSFHYVVDSIIEHADKVEDPDSKASMIWIVGHFAERIQNANAILEELTADFKTDALDVQLASVTAVAKLFIKCPDKGESLVISILKQATEQIDNPDVRDRGFFYWRILSVQDRFPNTAKEIIDGEIPPISNENDQLDPLILQELELNIGSLASIYLKPVGEVFRLARRKFLIDSPARSNESTRISTARSKVHDDTSTMSSDNLSPSERFIDDFDVPAVNTPTIKKQSSLSSGLSRRLTVTKTSLSRKLSIRGSFT